MRSMKYVQGLLCSEVFQYNKVLQSVEGKHTTTVCAWQFKKKKKNMKFLHVIG